MTSETADLKSPWVRPPVNQDVLPGDEAGLLAAQKRAGLTKLIGVAKALRGGQFFAGLHQRVHTLACFLGQALEGDAQAVGVKRTGQEVVDGDVA